MSALGLLLSATLLLFFMVNGLDQMILKPLAQMQSTIHRITSQRDLSLRLQVNQQDELGKLSAAFNDMLEAISKMVNSGSDPRWRRADGPYR